MCESCALLAESGCHRAVIWSVWTSRYRAKYRCPRSLNVFFDRSVVWCLAGVLAWVGCAGVEKESDGAGLVGVTTELRDADGDGFQTDEDCNDRDASINPGAVELCDGIDNDCSGEVDEAVTDTFYVDEDGDGYGWRDGSIQACAAPEGFVLGDTDCDDTDAA
ncbi:MAG TPA: hypothetical protein DFR83_09270, partial [Deltaproteobacteria bacterium]|nr:hypothetical protein [Deltaproteobacteria bacterium]